jgi:hypothetical protein
VNKVARMTKRDRADLFAETAERRDLSEAVVEKDFWVCWTLKQLFAIDSLRDRLLFKGGTSLSKINHAINRFSEDIDLAVDYVALGFTGDRDPRREGLSKSKRVAILAEMMTACQQYIGSEFLEVLRVRCEEILGNGEDWTLAVSEQDRNIVRFQYPSAAPTLDYIKPQVILELGTHAEFVPRDRFTVRAFAAEEFPALFAEPDVAVTSLLAKRTFWGKSDHSPCRVSSTGSEGATGPLFAALLRSRNAGTKPRPRRSSGGPCPLGSGCTPQGDVLSVRLGQVRSGAGWKPAARPAR